MCFYTWVWLRSFFLSTAEIWTVQRWKRENDFIFSFGCCWEKKPTRETCWLKLTGLSWAAIYLSPGFCSLECALSVFLLTFIISATRSLAFGLFCVKISHTVLSCTLLAPYYHTSNKRGCMVITGEVFHFTWNHKRISPFDHSLSSFPHVETAFTWLQ